MAGSGARLPGLMSRSGGRGAGDAFKRLGWGEARNEVGAREEGLFAEAGACSQAEGKEPVLREETQRQWRGIIEGLGSQRRSEGIRPGPRRRNSFGTEGTLHPRARGKEMRVNKVKNPLTSSMCLYHTLPHFTKDLRSFCSEVDRWKGTGS